MSPPPTNIDGTDITGATIDGQEVQEITVDGQTVFEAVSLPESAAYRWTHSEGSGTTLGDSIENNDGTISNPNWVSDPTAQGGQKLSFNDQNAGEFVDFATVSEVDASQDFAVGITIELDTLADVGVIWEHGDGFRSWGIGVSNDDLSEEVTAVYFDGSNFIDSRTLGADSTTNRMRLLVNYSLSDNQNRSLDMFKNGNDVDASASADENILVTQLSGHRIGSRIDDRSDGRLGGDTDDLILYNDVLTASEIQSDYEIQPWS
jgi:hypothetical protein